MLIQLAFLASPIISFNIFPTISPIAGDDVSPGDSIAAQSMKCGAPSTSPIMNSCLASWARSPANDVITFRIGRFFTWSFAFAIKSPIPSAVVFVPSLSSISIAVGPTIRLP